MTFIFTDKLLRRVGLDHECRFQNRLFQDNVDEELKSEQDKFKQNMIKTRIIFLDYEDMVVSQKQQSRLREFEVDPKLFRHTTYESTIGHLGRRLPVCYFFDVYKYSTLLLYLIFSNFELFEMTFQTRHIDMLNIQVTDDEISRTCLSISWDPAIKQYVVGLQFYYVKEAKGFETIYLDIQTLGSIRQRLPEVCRLLNTINSHHTKPVQNYQEAYHLCNSSLNVEDRRKWGACEFELPVP